MTEPTRCDWAERTPEERQYHDHEWGTPEHDDRRLFEFLILEGMQAGLSWSTVLRKRERFREAFCGFDPQRVAEFGEAEVNALMQDPGLIRNRAKLGAAPLNARAFLKVRDEFESFDRYLWRFVDGTPIQNALRNYREAPASTAVSERLSRDLKKRGFRFVGPVICYAYMQAVGLVNDHAVDCFRWRELGGA